MLRVHSVGDEVMEDEKYLDAMAPQRSRVDGRVWQKGLNRVNEYNNCSGQSAASAATSLLPREAVFVEQRSQRCSRDRDRNGNASCLRPKWQRAAATRRCKLPRSLLQRQGRWTGFLDLRKS